MHDHRVTVAPTTERHRVESDRARVLAACRRAFRSRDDGEDGTSREPSSESASIVACVERTFASFDIPAATEQDENDGGAAYVATSAGYCWRYGPPP